MNEYAAVTTLTITKCRYMLNATKKISCLQHEQLLLNTHDSVIIQPFME